MPYGTVAQALLWTLEQGPGEAWTPPLKERVTRATCCWQGVMQEAAAQR